MEDHSIFMDKEVQPDDKSLEINLGTNFKFWKLIKDYVYAEYPKAVEDWTFPGKKYGWNFRIKDKKRAIIYFLPREQYFKAAFVFGQKASDEIMQSDINQKIKDDLNSARVYAEGRGIHIEITDNKLIEDVKKLIDIKLKF